MLADDLFNAQHEVSRLEDAICDALTDAGITYEDFWVDHYDSSIEITCCPSLTGNQQAVLWSLGFFQAWTHPGCVKVREIETRYVSPAFVAAHSLKTHRG